MRHSRKSYSNNLRKRAVDVRLSGRTGSRNTMLICAIGRTHFQTISTRLGFESRSA